MTGGGKTIGESSVADYAAIKDRIKATAEACGFDLIRIHDDVKTSSLTMHVVAMDSFNARDEWSQPDLTEICVNKSFAFTLRDTVEEFEGAIHGWIQSKPSRLSRERNHMAWVLNGQMTRLGNYSSEARDAFLTAFRKSMDEGGLLSLTHTPSRRRGEGDHQVGPPVHGRGAAHRVLE